jgi:hypothetical protein
MSFATSSKFGRNARGWTNAASLADYWAGWFVARRMHFAPGNPVEGWSSLMAKGDYEFTSQQHHGTPKERAAAFKAGFNSHMLQQSPREAYLKGVEYINGL